MKNDTKKGAKNIENRLANLKNIYKTLESILSQLPNSIPENIRNMLKDKIIGDNGLKELMDGLENHRPPRFLLVGRTGVGKSSLINALCGVYTAEVSDTVSCTAGVKIYQCTSQSRVLMDILDTRGIAESNAIDNNQTAESQLLNEVSQFSPDAAIFMLNCVHRDSIDDDVLFVKKIIQQYEKENKAVLPVAVVLSRADDVMPGRVKAPKEYPETKIRNIEKIVDSYREIITKCGLKTETIIPISSYIEWALEDGSEVCVEDIGKLPASYIDKLQIAFDGRYNIEELKDALENAITDFRAKAGLRMALRLQELTRRIADKLTNIFAGISGTVALTPIPISDIYILLAIQAVLVTLIAACSGRDITLDTAREFILSLLGIGGAGWVLRLIAQQGAKVLNIWFPGGGSAISTTIAFLGTKSIGAAAIAYYMDDKPLKKVAESIRQSK